MSDDPLNIVGISYDLVQIEERLQSLPKEMWALDDQVSKAEMALKLARRDAARRLREQGSKLTVGERDMEIDTQVIDEWWQLEVAKNVVKEAERQFRALQAVMSSKQNRNRIAADADRAHGRYGQA